MTFAWTGTYTYPTRLLITVEGEPDRAVIVEGPDEAQRLDAAWSNLRYRRGEPMGGSIIERAAKCRTCGRWVRWLIGRCEPSCRIKERKAS